MTIGDLIKHFSRIVINTLVSLALLWSMFEVPLAVGPILFCFTSATVLYIVSVFTVALVFGYLLRGGLIAGTAIQFIATTIVILIGSWLGLPAMGWGLTFMFAFLRIPCVKVTLTETRTYRIIIQ